MNNGKVKFLLVLCSTAILIAGLIIVSSKYIRLRDAYISMKESLSIVNIGNSQISDKAALFYIKNELQKKFTDITNELSLGYEPFSDPNIFTLNNVLIEPVKSTECVRIVTFGHVYASLDSEVPAEILINNINLINEELNPHLVILLGDLVRIPSKEAFDSLKEKFLEKLTMPVFNSVGNHDVINGWSFYQEEMSQTFYTFSYGAAQIVVLDTEIGNCSVLGDQLTMLDEAFSRAQANPEIHYVLIFMHKVLFQSMDLPGVGTLVSNHEYCDVFGSNFGEILETMIIPNSESKPVYVFAGDVGKNENEFSYFTSQVEGTQVYFNTVGIGEQETDSIMLIKYNDESITLEKISLHD